MCKVFGEDGGRKGSYRNGHGLSADVMSSCSAMEVIHSLVDVSCTGC
jgi:hypothetical protein